MKSLILSAAVFAICIVTRAETPLATQEWVNMRLDQVKSELMAYINSKLPATTSNTNLTNEQVARNLALTSVANMMPLVHLLSTPRPYVPNPTGTVSYLVAGKSKKFRDMFPYGIRLNRRTEKTYACTYNGTNDIVLTLGAATNTLTFSTFELTAPTNEIFFKNATGDWVQVIDMKD